MLKRGKGDMPKKIFQVWSSMGSELNVIHINGATQGSRCKWITGHSELLGVGLTRTLIDPGCQNLAIQLSESPALEPWTDPWQKRKGVRLNSNHPRDRQLSRLISSSLISSSLNPISKRYQLHFSPIVFIRFAMIHSCPDVSLWQEYSGHQSSHFEEE